MSQLVLVGDKIAGIGVQALNLPVTWLDESFDKDDGLLGPDLVWENATALFDHPFQWNVVSDEAQLTANAAGTWEALSLCYPTVQSPNVEIKVDLTSVTRGLGTSAPEYVIDGGAGFRIERRDEGTDYRGYVAGIGRSNIFLPPGHTWHLAVFRVDTKTGNQILLDIALLGLGDVTLPGEFTFSIVGSEISCTFTHAGSGGTMVCSAVDATYSDGVIGLGGSVVLDDPTDTGTITLDNFRARALPDP